MNIYDNKPTGPRRIREPVQVYLDPADQDRLARLKERLNSSKSEVLRRGLEALERALTDPDHHPALQVIGIADESSAGREPDYDIAREHDRYLSDTEVGSWARGGKDESGAS